MLPKACTLIIILFFTTHLDCLSQNNSRKIKVDSIYIYNDFKSFGTTATLWSYHNLLDSLNHEKQLVGIRDLKEIQEITSRAKRKRLFQMKYGGSVCYLIIKDANSSRRSVAFINSDWAAIDDLKNMERWIIYDQQDIQKFEQIINKYWL